MKHNVEVRGHGHARHQGEPRQTFTDFHLQEEVNASCLLSTTTTCSSQLDTGGREQAATHTPLRTRSACKVDAHGRAHRLPSSNQLFVISARASETSDQAASTSLSVCSSIRGGRESASNAACSRQLVFSKSRRTPPPCTYPPAPIHGARPKARSVGSMSAPAA